MAEPVGESHTMEFVDSYLGEVADIAYTVDRGKIRDLILELTRLRDREGRLFALGVGGSAANASHVVNDLRKIARIQAYAPTDNVAELTAWTNDISWDVTFLKWLEGSRLAAIDAVLVLSVGGGSERTSPNLVRAIDYARTVGSRVLSIVSRDGGHAARHSDVCVLIPVVNSDRITPHAEEWQGIVCHMVVSALTEP